MSRNLKVAKISCRGATVQQTTYRKSISPDNHYELKCKYLGDLLGDLLASLLWEPSLFLFFRGWLLPDSLLTTRPPLKQRAKETKKAKYLLFPEVVNEDWKLLQALAFSHCQATVLGLLEISLFHHELVFVSPPALTNKCGY